MSAVQSINPQEAEDSALLQQYPQGVVPAWNSAFCKAMLSSWFRCENDESFLRLQRVTMSPDGESWSGYDDQGGGAYNLYKWITQGDADDEYEHYLEVVKAWRDSLTRRVKEAFNRQAGPAQQDAGTSIVLHPVGILRPHSVRVSGSTIQGSATSSVLAVGAPADRARGVKFGYTECPGITLHTTPNALHDCIVYNNDGIPFVHCFHQSCCTVRKALNARLFREALASGRVGLWTKDPVAAERKRIAYEASCLSE